MALMENLFFVNEDMAQVHEFRLCVFGFHLDPLGFGAFRSGDDPFLGHVFRGGQGEPGGSVRGRGDLHFLHPVFIAVALGDYQPGQVHSVFQFYNDVRIGFLIRMLMLPPVFGGQIMIWWSTVFAKVITASVSIVLSVRYSAQRNR